MSIPKVIAEVGVNFYDSAKKLDISPLDAAKLYVDEAAKAGADIVKFQSYKADTLVSKHSPAYWDLLMEPTTTQHALFKKHDGFNKEDFERVCAHCRFRNIGFMSTPFDNTAVDYLMDMVDSFKISASDITNIPFLKYIAGKNKPIYLSTGASYISEIDNAVRTIQDAGCPELSLFHCVLCYPTKYEDANLNMIGHLKQVFPHLTIGYSDHTPPDATMTVLSAAFLLGAEIIEKHFTLDKTLVGNDHYHAMDPDDLRVARNNFKLILTTRGLGYKTALPCEMISRKEARRSLVINRDKRCGETIRVEDISIKRPGTGIKPEDFEKVVGRVLKKEVSEDTVLTWEML